MNIDTRKMHCWPIRLALACTIAAACLAPTPAVADVTPALPFGDHMVLQRGMLVPVWGRATPGEAVTVEFAGQKKTTTADARGQWAVRLDALDAHGDGRTLTITGTNKITLKDVLVGEVWLCAGQSNMQVGMERLINSNGSPALKARAREVYGRDLETKTPGIRLFRSGTSSKDATKNTWMECGPEALKGEGGQGFSAAAYFFAKKLHQELKVPIGAMEAAVGGTRIEKWTPAAAYAALPAFRAEAAATPLVIDGIPPGGKYRSLVEPLIPFGLRGVVWYQGESNLLECGEGLRYADKMQALIHGWREVWKQPELPFYYVQLPPYLYSKKKPRKLTTESLPLFREAQASAQRIPHTAMVVTTDLVDVPGELHPPNKWDIGDRLARLALAKTYARHEVAFSGPVYKSFERHGGKIVLTFDHVEGGLRTGNGKPLSDFMISGSDRRFVPAQATIEGDKVVVSSPQVAEPAAVRFGWHEAAMPNLCNKAGLPAAPFRTE